MLLACLLGAFTFCVLFNLIFVILNPLFPDGESYWPPNQALEDLGQHMLIGAITGGLAGLVFTWFRGRLSRPTHLAGIMLLVSYALYLGWSPLHRQALTIALCDAIKNHDRAAVRKILDRGVDTRRLHEHTNEYGSVIRYTNPALGVALTSGDSVILTLLLERGIPVNSPVEGNDTALIAAIDAKRADFLQILLQHGASANLKADSGKIPLRTAIDSGDPACCRVLLEHGADANATFENGMPALCYADYFQSDPTLIALLLDHGANLTTCDSSGENALQIALRANHLDMARLLVARGAPRHVFDAVMLGDVPTLERLLHNGANIDEDDRSIPLQDAIAAKNFMAVRLLLQHKANVEAKDGSGLTPLLNAVDANNLPMVRLLLEHGANVEAKHSYGATPLLNAVSADSVPMVQLLLHYGANINARMVRNKNALMVLDGSVNFNPTPPGADPTQMIDTLVHAGIDLKARDQNGETALDYFRQDNQDGFRQKAFHALLKYYQQQ